MKRFKTLLLSGVCLSALVLSACQTAGQFDPVKTQVNAHNDHAAAAAAAEVSAEQGLLKGVNATAAEQGLDKTEAAVTVADAVLQVANDPTVEAAAQADAKATATADDALTKAAQSK